MVLDQMELIMGASVSAEELLGDDNTNIPDSDVQGVLVDYETLRMALPSVPLGSRRTIAIR